jgi:hypothetical protein
MRIYLIGEKSIRRPFLLLCSLRVSRFKEVGPTEAGVWDGVMELMFFLGFVVEYQLVGINRGKKLGGFGN